MIARCTNLPVKLRNGDGIGGGRLVGWLPIVGSCSFSHHFCTNGILPRLRRMPKNLGGRTM